MTQLVLFEDEGYINFLPLTFWRTVFEVRVGRKILLDQIAQRAGHSVAGVWTRDWISKVAEQRCGAPANREIKKNSLLLNGRWILPQSIKLPKAPCVGLVGDEVACIACDERLASELTPRDLLDSERTKLALADVPTVELGGRLLRYPWDIIHGLRETLEHEWQKADAGLESELDANLCFGPKDRVHVGERASVHRTAVIDATSGPIYISHDIEIGAYAVLEGPLYIGPGCVVHPYSWLHGGNAIGPVCKVGGELDACVIQGYSNKQHGGFLGHSYVGSWVNLGAGTVNSDLKNTYGPVRVPINGTDVETKLTFFGAVIADHVKTGINTGIPTGSVMGFAASSTGGRLVPKWVPSFAWVTEHGIGGGKPDRLLDVASRIMSRRNIDLTDDEVELFLDLGARVREFESPARRPMPALSVEES